MQHPGVCADPCSQDVTVYGVSDGKVNSPSELDITDVFMILDTLAQVLQSVREAGSVDLSSIAPLVCIILLEIVIVLICSRYHSHLEIGKGKKNIIGIFTHLYDQ